MMPRRPMIHRRSSRRPAALSSLLFSCTLGLGGACTLGHNPDLGSHGPSDGGTDVPPGSSADDGLSVGGENGGSGGAPEGGVAGGGAGGEQPSGGSPSIGGGPGDEERR